MGSFSVAVRTGWLTAATGGAAYTNAEIWVQLHIGDPGAAGTDNPAANTTRMQVTFTTPASGSTSNSVAVVWANVPATETYTHVSLWSLAVAGGLIGTDDLAAPIAMTAGGTATIPVGDIVLAVA